MAKAKPRLFIQIEGEEIKDISLDQHELVESVYKEVGDYSLTPTNIESRKLNIFNSVDNNIEVQEPDLQEMINSFKNQLSIATHISNKQQQELLTSNLTIKPESAKKLYIQAKEKSYIDDYNKITEGIKLNGEPYSFIDQYKGVVRHGINANGNTINIVLPFNKFIESKIEEYNHLLGETVAKSGSDKGGSNKDSQKSTNKLTFDENSLKILHTLEVLKLKNAIIDAIENKQKAILVDIFERNKDGTIAIEKVQASSQDIMLSTDAYKPKTHTIVLCRKEILTNEDQCNFLVIDPSNSEFSKHLGILGVNKIISGLLDKDIKLEVSNKSYKIYEQNSKIGTGLGINKFRDCIDIAFKIAKNLNEYPEKVAFDVNDKLPIIFDNSFLNKIVQCITNNRDLDNSIEEALSDKKFLNYPFRGKQLTDLEKGQIFYNNQVSVYKKINDHVKSLPLDPLNKLAVVDDMYSTFNDPMNGERVPPFLQKVDQSIALIQQINKIFIPQENVLESEVVPTLGETFIQVSHELFDYYQ
jgi:hypothetical protein